MDMRLVCLYKFMSYSILFRAPKRQVAMKIVIISREHPWTEPNTRKSGGSAHMLVPKGLADPGTPARLVETHHGDVCQSKRVQL